MPEGENRDFVLLGIRYEAARVGGLGVAALAQIAAGIRDEAGEDWESNGQILRGRNAVRDEHGLPRIGEPPRESPPAPARRPFLKRLLGR